MPNQKSPLSYQSNGVLTAKIQRAIEHYIDTRDIDKAELLAGMDLGEFRRVFDRPEVKAEVERKLEIEDEAAAALRADARRLHADVLDKHLLKAVEVGASKGDPRALELAYERIGMRRDDNFMTAAQSTEQTRPAIYRAIERTTTVREIAVHEQEQQVALPAKSSPPTIDIEEY